MQKFGFLERHGICTMTSSRMRVYCLIRCAKETIFTWTLIITCCARSWNIEEARELFDLLPDRRNAACWNALISGYSKRARLREARELFHEIPVKDFSWNAMLAGYTQNGQMLVALRFFKEMLEKDVVHGT